MNSAGKMMIQQLRFVGGETSVRNKTCSLVLTCSLSLLQLIPSLHMQKTSRLKAYENISGRIAT